MKSSSQHSFAIVPHADIPRASFKRNMTYKTTMDAGYLVPIFVDEVLPGDTFNLKLTTFSRLLSPLQYPIMDNMYMDFQFYFVPVRLVYDDYEKFFGSSAGREGNWQFDDSHLMPGITSPASTGWTAQSIGDYFGLPIGVTDLRVNALPFRAYNRIIADWYLPSSYELPSPVLNTGSTDDDPADYVLWKRLKRADAFTASLIAPQRGNGVELPLGGYAPVVGNGIALGLTDGTGTVVGFPASNALGLAKSTANPVGLSVGSAANADSGNAVVTNKLSLGVSTDPAKSGLVTDLSSATAATINSLRQAFQLQRALERDMRGGVMYVSQLMSHFGVRSPDARLQRSEYLGGGSVPIQVHTVTNTTGTATRDQGSLAGYAVTAQSKVGFVKSFVEHGYIIGLASVRADLTYQQGVPPMFDRFARFDHYYPVFAHLGEEAVKNKYLYAQGSSVVDANGDVIDEQPFGYQERYWSYRYGISKITGQLRSTYSTPLDAWHLAQKFNNLPTLNTQFLEENVPLSRVKAVTSGPDFLYDSLITLNCVRPMPLFGVPGLVDHY